MEDSKSFNPTDCPVGIENRKDIEHIGDRLDMAIDRLTEKVSEMKEDISTLSDKMDKNFISIDNKFDAVDKRFDSMEEKFDRKIGELRVSIPDTVDTQMRTKKGQVASDVLKWVICGAGGTILITIITGLFRKWLNI